MKHGMTLTSLLLAVALSGIIAVFGGRLVVNQMFMAATAELIDKGDAIMQFYLNALRDREVWRCTVFDTANATFRNLLFAGAGTNAQVSLREPNCKPLTSIAPTKVKGQEWRNHPILFSSVDRGKELLPKTGKYVGDAIAGPSVGATEGWWKIDLKAKKEGGEGDVDLILTLCLQESIYTQKHEGHKQVPRGYRYKCSEPSSKHMTRRVRYSENAIKDDCSNKAIISVDDRTATRTIGCSRQSLLTIPATKPSAWQLAPTRQLREQDVTRQGVIPETCPGRRPIVHVSRGDVDCGSGALVRQLPTSCPTDRAGMDKVLCGFSEGGEATCCTPKGPKGPKGLQGCPPVIVINEDNMSNRICRPNISNDETCPGLTNYIVTSRPLRCLQ